MQGNHIAILLSCVGLLTNWFEPLEAFVRRSDLPKKCQIPYDIGTCKASFRRYYYDVRTGKCQEFIYGGCGGNTNNFRCEQDCIKACSSNDLPPRCEFPKAEGSGETSIRRYYYDFVTGTCEQFFYRGCGGNSNNFLKKIDCLKMCRPNGDKELVFQS